MEGFCKVEVNPPGPVQLYVAPATAAVHSAVVAPGQYGPVFDAVGVAGVALTTTVVVPAAETQPLTITVTPWSPLMAVVAVAMEVMSKVEVNPPGPVQLYVAPPTAGVDRADAAP